MSKTQSNRDGAVQDYKQIDQHTVKKTATEESGETEVEGIQTVLERLPGRSVAALVEEAE